MDNNTQNVNNHPIKIPGVEIPGMDNDNDKKRRYIVPNYRHEDGLNMNLRNVSRINYKFIHDGKEIPMNDEEEMIFLHLNDENDIEEDLIDEYEAEYMFLSEKGSVHDFQSACYLSIPFVWSETYILPNIHR